MMLTTRLPLLVFLPIVTSFLSDSYHHHHKECSEACRLHRLRRQQQHTTTQTYPISSHSSKVDDDDDDKFSFGQRIESIKCLIVGGLSGSVCVTPFTALHDLVLDDFIFQRDGAGGVAQWEFDTDMAALQGALFAIVYRYCIRQKDNNPMLNQGVLGAFVLIRTLSRIRVPYYCSAIPLDCGDPLGYLDWSMLSQVVVNGLESAALFGAASAAIEFSFQNGWISKFP